MNVTVPQNVTVPEQVAQGLPPGYYPGYNQGYKAGFKYAIGAFQELITAIFVASIMFWVIRLVVNRVEPDVDVDVGFAQWHVDQDFLKETTQQVYFSIILAVSGFMLYFLVF